ncbi:DUF6387 family protein [Paraburkholderia sp. SIMBA_009]
MARKKSAHYVQLSELPHEFEIKKYDVCLEWDLGMWAANLARRITFKMQFDDDVAYNSRLHSVPTRGQKQYEEMLAEIPINFFADPEVIDTPYVEDGETIANYPFEARARRVGDVSTLEYLAAHELFLDPAFEKYTKDYNLIDKGLRHVTAEGVFDSYAALSGSEDEAQQWLTKKQAYLRLLNTPEWEISPDDSAAPAIESWLPPIAHVYPFALAKIDLEASDSELIEDFARWLDHARATRGVQQASGLFGAAEVERWAEYRVLAYIDLQLWLQTIGKSITQPVLGDILYPDLYGQSRESRIQKTIPAYAADLMNPRVVRAMQSQYLKAESDKRAAIPESKSRK